MSNSVNNTFRRDSSPLIPSGIEEHGSYVNQMFQNIPPCHNASFTVAQEVNHYVMEFFHTTVSVSRVEEDGMIDGFLNEELSQSMRHLSRSTSRREINRAVPIVRATPVVQAPPVYSLGEVIPAETAVGFLDEELTQAMQR